jgi:hypothetical protein
MYCVHPHAAPLFEDDGRYARIMPYRRARVYIRGELGQQEAGKPVPALVILGYRALDAPLRFRPANR